MIADFCIQTPYMMESIVLEYCIDKHRQKQCTVVANLLCTRQTKRPAQDSQITTRTHSQDLDPKAKREQLGVALPTCTTEIACLVGENKSVAAFYRRLCIKI